MGYGDSPGGADGHGLFALAGAEDGERGGAGEMMKAMNMKRRNTSIGRVHGRKGAGEVRQCLIYVKLRQLFAKCALGQALMANDVCWTEAA